MEYQDKLNALIGLWNQLKVSYAKELRNYDLTFDTAKRRLGQCNYAKRLISLSKVHIEATNLDQMFDVLKHEVAHAYAYHHHRHRGAGHNGLFYKACEVVGARPERCASVSGDVKEIPCKFVGLCKIHGLRSRFYRGDISRTRSCGLCSPKFDDRFLLDIVKYEDYIKGLKGEQQ